MNSERTSRKKTLGFRMLMLLAFLSYFGGLHYNNLNSVWERDEGEYAYSAWLMEQGQIPYQQSFLQKPPLIIYTYYLSNKINPNAYWPPRLLGALFTLLTVLILAATAQKEFGGCAGLIALWLGPAMLLPPHLTPFAANTEKFMLLPLSGLLALSVFCKQSHHKSVGLGAGALAALAVLYKPIALPPALMILLYRLATIEENVPSIKKKVGSMMFILGGGLMATLLTLSYFLINGGLKEMWETVVVFNRYYASQFPQFFPDSFFRYFSVFLKQWWGVILLSAAGLIWRWRKMRYYAALWLVSLLPIITTPIGHYYLLLMPFWIMMVSGSLEELLKAIPRKKENLQRTMALPLLALLLGTMVWPIANLFFLSPSQFTLFLYGPHNPFIEAGIMAQQVARVSTPTDKIFVAASEPQIYYFSKRLSSSRFIITYPLMIDTPMKESYQRQAVKELEQNRPAVIVWSQTLYGAWEEGSASIFLDYLKEEIKNHYQLQGGVVLDQATGEGLWQEQMNPAQRSKASLLLYARRKR